MKFDSQQFPIECPVCSGISVNKWKSKTVNHIHFTIVRCDTCGFSFVNPKPTAMSLGDYYASAQNEKDVIAISDMYNEVISQECERPNSTIDATRIISTIESYCLEEGERLFLDVGCGYGFFSKEAIDAGFLVKSIEINSVDSQISSMMLGNPVENTSYEDFDPHGVKYDIVLMSHILEHAYDINFWMKKTSDIMCIGGILAISVPNFSSLIRYLLRERDPFVTPPEHLNYFNKNNISILFSEYGFELLYSETRSNVTKRNFASLLGDHVASFAWQGLSRLLSVADARGLGQTLTVYARKIS